MILFLAAKKNMMPFWKGPVQGELLLRLSTKMIKPQAGTGQPGLCVQRIISVYPRPSVVFACRSSCSLSIRDSADYLADST
jgi:hypothetical protein